MEKISVKINHKELIVNFWKTAHNNPKGIFYIHHGMAEHIDRYCHVAEHLNRAGFHVVGHDHLGHGKNKENGQGIFAIHNGWNKVTNEATAVINNFNQSYPNMPSYLYGHSMGGFISLFSMKSIKNLKGVILTGIFLPSKAQIIFLKNILKIEKFFLKKNQESIVHKLNFQRLNSFIKDAKTDFDWLSTDEEEVDKYIKDPNCGFNCSNSLWQDFNNGGEMLLEEDIFLGVNSDIKIFLAGGEVDPCISTGRGINGLKIFLTNVFKNTIMMKYPKKRHEIQNESCCNKFLEDAIKFFEDD